MSLPLTRDGLYAALVIGALLALGAVPIPALDLLLRLCASVATAATCWNVIEHVGRGEPGFPAPVTLRGLEPGALLARASVGLLAACAPLGLWWARNPGAETPVELVVSRPGTAAVLGALTVAWLTAGVLATTASASALAPFWPPALVTVVGRAPRLYLHLVAIVGTTTTALLALRWSLVHLVGFLPGPLVDLLVGSGTALGVFAQAALAGAFVSQHREVYGG